MWRLRVKQQSHGGRANQGSLGGAPFIVPENEASFGRRTELHEYPERDLPYVEDLGRKAREFNLTVFVDASLTLDEDYLAARDALIAVIEKPGPHTLIHPYYGTLRVSITVPARVRDSTREGGRATFTFTCVESGDLVFADAEYSTVVGVQDAAGSAEASAIDDFVATFSVDGLPDFHLAEIETDLTRTLGELTKVVGDVAGAIADEIRAPANMAGAIVGAIGNIATAAGEPLRALKLYENLFDAGDDGKAVPLTTSTRQRQAQSLQAQRLLVQRAAIVAAARSSSEAEYASLDDALAVRDRLVAAIDAQLEATDTVSGANIDDDVFLQLSALRAAVARDLLIRGGKLPRITRYTSPSTLPALVIAHRVYGDASRADEIVSRNKVRHPGFVPGGVALEVLSD
ncbi:MAG TPA: DNA circularization N-terminal domain-containing protein [Acidiferrobacterales bacterium]|nr:DNA circularization N-terminal domain-containing protein [Acidiferrobacterales bacterium]